LRPLIEKPIAKEDYSHLEKGLPQMSFSLMKMSDE